MDGDRSEESARRGRTKQREAKERVRSGIASAELEWPMRRITVNLALAACFRVRYLHTLHTCTWNRPIPLG